MRRLDAGKFTLALSLIVAVITVFMINYHPSSSNITEVSYDVSCIDTDYHNEVCLNDTVKIGLGIRP